MTAGLSGLGTKRRSRPGIPVLPILSTLLLLAAAGLFVLELVTFSQEADLLPTDVTVAGVPVGGLSAGEAVTRWENALMQPVTLWYNDSPIVVDPAALGFRINSAAMLADVRATADIAGSNWQRFFNYLTGQEAQNTINIPVAADYQQNLLEQLLREIGLRYDQPPGRASYDAQTLTVRPGPGGYALNQRAALAAVDAALYNPDNRTVALPVENTGTGSTDISVLRDTIIEYLDSQGFLYDSQNTVASVYIQDLQTGEEVNLLGDVAFSAASTIKTAILIDYFRYLSLAPTDEEAYLMANSLLCSNNSSSNLIMQIIGGGTNIFNGLVSVTNTAQYLGARNTFISAPFVLGVQGEQLGSVAVPPTSPNPDHNTNPDPFNQTTAEDLGTLFGMIYDCATYGSGLMAAFPDGEFTQNECRQMLELMSANDLQRLLQGGIPAGERISHKNGWLSTMHGDAGIVYSPNGRHYIVSVFLWENTDFFSYERAWPLIEGISRAAWNYFNPESPLLAARSDLPPTAMECSPEDGTPGFLPPFGEVNLNDINAWRRNP